LPRLQVVHFGSAQMGFGDFFIAATLGCLVATRPIRQRRATALVAIFALAFDLLFFAVDVLPATVPVALALAAVEWLDRASPTPRSGRSPRRRTPAGPPA
jgi:hypothetical protein